MKSCPISTLCIYLLSSYITNTCSVYTEILYIELDSPLYYLLLKVGLAIQSQRSLMIVVIKSLMIVVIKYVYHGKNESLNSNHALC